MPNTERKFLKTMLEMEDLAEKKAKIYSRLLTEPLFAKEMEGLSLRHEKRKEKLVALCKGEEKNEKTKGQVRDEI